MNISALLGPLDNLRMLPPSPPTSPQRSLRSPRRQTALRGLRLLARLIFDRLVHAQDQASGLDRRLDGVHLHEARLPDKRFHVVSPPLIVEVYTRPDIPLAMFYTKAVEDVGSVEAGVVAELTRYDLKGFCKRFDDGLLFVGHVFVGVSVEEA